MENDTQTTETKKELYYPSNGNFVHWYIMQNHIKKADVARALGISPRSLTAYLKRETLQFELLWKISLFTKHNFLAHMGEYLPDRYETKREKELKEQLAEKEEIIKKMEIQMEVYEKMAK